LERASYDDFQRSAEQHAAQCYGCRRPWVVDSWSEPAGSNNLTFNAAGTVNYNPATKTATIQVQYLQGGICDGDAGHQILQPINADGGSVFTGKSTSPAKFRVCDVNGVSIGTPGVVSSFFIYKIVGGTIIDNIDEAVLLHYSRYGVSLGPDRSTVDLEHQQQELRVKSDVLLPDWLERRNQHPVQLRLEVAANPITRGRAEQTQPFLGLAR
jgi:hypothetical protein